MLTTQALVDLRTYIRKRIAKAQYQVGSAWYDAPIVGSEITSAGIVRIKSQIAHGSACTIVAVRLINTEGAVWATKTVNVVIENSTTNLLQWFEFTVTETEEG